MSSYRLYPRADKQQDRIWQYTVEQWSVEQAEKYIHGLHEHFHAFMTPCFQLKSQDEQLHSQDEQLKTQQEQIAAMAAKLKAVGIDPDEI